MAGYIHDDPFDKGSLAVGTIHQIHYEQYGNPDGRPGKSERNSRGQLEVFVYRLIIR